MKRYSKEWWYWQIVTAGIIFGTLAAFELLRIGAWALYFILY